MKLTLIVGARPNFMKIAPIMDALRSAPNINPLLVHTGQHYDEKMSDLFFRDLGIPKPDINLGIGGGSHAAQTAAIVTSFEPVILEHRPDAVLVVGDVNSTIACGLVAVKLGVKLIHVEAGLRSFDRTMPEEINRILTDSISDLLLCTEKSGVDNLLREGHSPEQIHLVGNVMIDSLLKHRVQAEQTAILEQLEVTPRNYAVVTLHRPSNVDQPEALGSVLQILSELQKRMKVVFPIHPRTRNRLSQFGLDRSLADLRNVKITDPLGYLEFLKLAASARVVLTDSGGVQEETTILDVRCVTMRDNTERPVTCELGTNRIAGTKPEGVIRALDESLANGHMGHKVPPLWDGCAAERIVRIIVDKSREWGVA